MPSLYKETNYPGLVLNTPHMDGAFVTDCFKGITDLKYLKTTKSARDERGITNILEMFAPSYNEDFYAYNDLIESVLNCKSDFTMVELGSGFGRWLVHAANLCKMRNLSIGMLIGYEAEKTHYQWMVEHFNNNRIHPENRRLMNCAVGIRDEMVPFYMGCADSWYGQSIASNIINFGRPKFSGIRKVFNKFFGNPVDCMIECNSLKTVLKDYSEIDFIHMDIQGSEFDVLCGNEDLLHRKVKRIHISTHDQNTEPTQQRDMDSLIYDFFSKMQWENQIRIKPNCEKIIDQRLIKFVDGIQTWINPKWEHPFTKRTPKS